jgi:predicted DsbA family dithiol-disulfide isomerase
MSPRRTTAGRATAGRRVGGARLRIDLFTDPACPFAFSHEPVRWRLLWLYGNAVTWRPRMIGLADSVAEMEARGLTPALVAKVRATLAEQHGMPIASEGPDRLRPTRLASLAVVGTRLAAPSRVEPLLRALRVLAMAGAPIDEPEVVAVAASASALRPADVLQWTRAGRTVEALKRDMAAARDPAPGARALPEGLACSDGVLRYTAPSYVLHCPGRSPFAIPGFRAAEVYETAIANLLPDVRRRPPPEKAIAVLEWAAQPLATREVAAVLGVDAEEVRRRLESSAAFHPAGPDGYWTLPQDAAPRIPKELPTRGRKTSAATKRSIGGIRS